MISHLQLSGRVDGAVAVNQGLHGRRLPLIAVSYQIYSWKWKPTHSSDTFSSLSKKVVLQITSTARPSWNAQDVKKPDPPYSRGCNCNSWVNHVLRKGQNYFFFFLFGSGRLHSPTGLTRQSAVEGHWLTTSTLESKITGLLYYSLHLKL